MHKFNDSDMDEDEQWKKEKNEVLRLYAYLEIIASTEDNERGDIEELEKLFESFFHTKIKHPQEANLRLAALKDASFLSTGKVLQSHRTKIFAKAKDIGDGCLNGDSLLLRAMSINVKENSPRKQIIDKVIKCIIQYCPELISFEKVHKDCKGVTPVHLAIVQEDKKLLKNMANKLNEEVDTTQQREKLKSISAVGAVFQDTVVMAGTLLGVASLKFNEEIFRIVLGNFMLELDVTNEKGDNIIHSLIKYACIKPEKLDSVLKMLGFILDYEFIQKGCKKGNKEVDSAKRCTYFMDNEWNFRKQVRKLLMMTNKERLTPLQLAAKRQQFKIFEVIVSHEVYLSRESNGALFNENIYDVTEIDTLEIDSELHASHEEDIKAVHHESVLEYVLHHQTKNAFLFTNVTPVKEVIREKWKHYKPWFLVWFAFYLVFMILLSYAAVLRSQVTGSVSENSTVEFVHSVTKNVFVTTVSAIGLLLAVVFISMECARKMASRFRSQVSSKLTKRIIRHFSTPYSNFMFRMYFVLFSFLLILDFIFAAIMASGNMSGYDNYCLIFAIIIGWYLVLFFLQVFKVFSFYTVLIQRVISDMIKFAFVMGIFLVAFSIAMYMIMQGADTEDGDFNHVGKTMVKMLTIMLGIGELDILFQARQPVLAVIVFVLFVLLTTILLLNALIAMMSNTCTDLMSNTDGVIATKMHYRLQKLSVILFLEGFLPRRFCMEVGTQKEMLRYDNENNEYQRILRRRWTRKFVHGHVETEPETSEEPVQLTHNILDNFNMRQMFISKQERKRKKSKQRQGKVFPDIQFVSDQRSVQRQLDVTDIERTTCESCQKETKSISQTQEIKEVTDYTDTF